MAIAGSNSGPKLPIMELENSDRMNWILGSARRDLWLTLPGLFGIALVFTHDLPAVWAVALFMTFALVDSGHVYTTFLRTHWKNPDKKNQRHLSLISLGIFVAITTWCLIGSIGLWSFVAYATVFHHIRQHYGIVRWYDGANKTSRPHQNYWLFYALLILSICSVHFRSLSGGTDDILYSNDDLFLYPNSMAFQITAGLYLFGLALWLKQTLVATRANRAEVPAKLYEATALVTYAWAGFFAPSFLTGAIPMFLSHGVPYVALIVCSLPRTRRDHFKTLKVAFAASVAAAVLFGVSEWLVESYVIEDFFSQTALSPIAALAIGAYLTPLLSHYIYDGIIWKRKYSESKAVYDTPTERREAA
jgi:hypothetical protein